MPLAPVIQPGRYRRSQNSPTYLDTVGSPPAPPRARVHRPTTKLSDLRYTLGTIELNEAELERMLHETAHKIKASQHCAPPSCFCQQPRGPTLATLSLLQHPPAENANPPNQEAPRPGGGQASAFDQRVELMNLITSQMNPFGTANVAITGSQALVGLGILAVIGLGCFAQVIYTRNKSKSDSYKDLYYHDTPRRGRRHYATDDDELDDDDDATFSCSNSSAASSYSSYSD